MNNPDANSGNGGMRNSMCLGKCNGTWNGDANIKNILRVNGDAQYLDSYGIVKRNRNSISQNLTIGGGDNAASYGPVAIASGYTVTISSGGVWNIL